MYERFTDRARKIMQLANQEAQRFNHEYIGTEHILLGLTKEGTGVAANTLIDLGLSLAKIRLEIEKIVTVGPDMVTMGKLPQTPRAKKVIELAIQCARDLQNNYVGSEHLLMGLVLVTEGAASQVLATLGIDVEGIKKEMFRLLGRTAVDAQEALAKEKPIEALRPADRKAIEGVGVLRYPGDIDPDMAVNLTRLLAMIRQGVSICLPNVRDDKGNYVWDFTIVAGDFDQVKIERIDADEPIIVE